MNFLDIAGIRFQTGGSTLGEVGRTHAQAANGSPISSDGIGGINRDEREITHRLDDADVARFWFRLFRGEGHVWGFEANDDLSANGLPTIDAITPATDNPKWGTYHADRAGSDIDIVGIAEANNFTVVYWYDDGTGYAHVVTTRLPGDVADRIWVDGVRNDAYPIPHVIATSTLTLDTNGDFDDIVVLPFGTPNELAEIWPRFHAFTGLPELTASGNQWTDRRVKVVGPPTMSAQKSGTLAKYTVSARLRTGAHADVFKALPDFEGLTRIEWAIETLPGGHLALVDSWTDVGPNEIELTAAGAARPTWRNDGALGRTLRFDGAADVMDAIGLALDFSGGLTIAICADWTTLGPLDGPIRGHATAAANAFEIYHSGGLLVWAANRDSTVLGFTTSDADFVAGAELITVHRFDQTISPDEEAALLQGQLASAVSPSGGGSTMFPQSTINEIHTSGNSGALFAGDIYCIAMWYGRTMTLAESFGVSEALRRRYPGAY